MFQQSLSFLQPSSRLKELCHPLGPHKYTQALGILFFFGVLILHDHLVGGRKKIKCWSSIFSLQLQNGSFKSLLNARICLDEKLEFGMFIQPWIVQVNILKLAFQVDLQPESSVTRHECYLVRKEEVLLLLSVWVSLLRNKVGAKMPSLKWTSRSRKSLSGS